VLKFRDSTGAAVLACAVMTLSACGGGGGSSGTASVRLANATSTHASLDLLANGAAAVTATPTDTVSAYVGVVSGGPSLQVNDSATNTALGTIAPTLVNGAHYVVVAYDSGGTLHTTVIGEDVVAPAAGTSSLRIIDAASDAGAIDVYVTDPATDITTLSTPSFTFPLATTLQTSQFLSFAPGTYRIRVTGSGNPSDLRLDIPSVTLASQEVGSVILTPSVGGTLVNGAVLAEQAAYTAARNPNARVRLAAAVTPGATVTANAGGTAISPGNVLAPAVGAYAVIPATAAINVSVNGASVGAPATTLTAGSDATLLVYGSAAAPTTTLIADDNHLPASSSNFKLRLLNGLTGAAQPLELDAAFAVVASNVTPGTASSYALVPSSTVLGLNVFSLTTLTSFYNNQALSIPGNAVYTLFILGDATPSAVVPLLRKDR
jgi:hypothetical protein